MKLFINSYYISFGLITILNKGGAYFGFGIINNTLLLILLAPLLYFGLKKNLSINSDIPALIFVSISLLALSQHIISSGISSDSIRTAGILLYPVSILAGISLAKPKNFRRSMNVLKIVFTLSILYTALYPFKKILVYIIMFNDL